MQLSRADEAFCRIMANKLLKKGWLASSVLEHITRRAERPVIDLRETKNVTEVAEELGVMPSVVLDAIYDLGIPLVGRGRRYELTDEQVRQITARIGVAP